MEQMSLSSGRDSLSVLLPIRVNGDGPIMFCVHPAGGLGWGYMPWRATFPGTSGSMRCKRERSMAPARSPVPSATWPPTTLSRSRRCSQPGPTSCSGTPSADSSSMRWPSNSGKGATTSPSLSGISTLGSSLAKPPGGRLRPARSRVKTSGSDPIRRRRRKG